MTIKFPKNLTALFFLATSFLATPGFAQLSQPGATDIQAYLLAVPALPGNLSEAAGRAYGPKLLQASYSALDSFYHPFSEAAGSAIRAYEERLRQDLASQPDAAAYFDQAVKDANSNPIVANMGGYEKVSQMSEEERRAAALKAAAQFAAAPTGDPSGGMAALYQKVASDPQYAARFQNMSEAEKEAELRKYMAGNQPAALSPAQMEEKQRKEKAARNQADLVRNAQEIQLKLSDLHQKLGAAGLQYGQWVSEIEQKGRNHEIIGEEMEVRHKAIPLVDLGEYGRDHDPEMVKALQLEAAGLHRQRASLELTAYLTAWDQLRKDYLAVITEYLSYVTENRQKIYNGMSAEDIMHGLNTEMPLLQFEASLIGLTHELCRQAKDLILRTAQWEKSYQEIQSY